MTTRVLAALALAAASKAANVQTFEDVCVPTTDRRRPQASARPSRPSMLVRPPRVMGPVEYRPRLLLDVLAREAWSKRDSHAQASAVKSTATPYSSSTGMGQLDVHLHVPLFIFGASG